MGADGCRSHPDHVRTLLSLKIMSTVLSKEDQLCEALYQRGIDAVPEDWEHWGITVNDTVDEAELKVLKRFKCICGEEWKDHENGDKSNFHALGGCKKSGCGRFTMPRPHIN